MSCPDYPPGCAHITSLDFARLMLMKNGTLNGVYILEPQSVELMMTPTGFRNLDGWQQGIEGASYFDLPRERVRLNAGVIQQTEVLAQ
jgi:hypothetical protein